MKKGFTLIELLAVIVILAVIALIATPLILNTIDKAKKGAFESTAYGIINAAELYYTESLYQNDGNFTEKTFFFPNSEGLNYKGEKPTSGNLIISNKGEIDLAIYNGVWCATKTHKEEKVILTKSTKELCKVINSTPSNEITASDIEKTGEKIGNRTYFRGTNPNNWVSFNNELWRIISIEKGLTKIMRENPIQGMSWSYVSQKGWNETAELNRYLNTTYYQSLLPNSKEKIEEVNWAIGVVPPAVSAEVAVTKELTKTWQGKIGLMNVSDFGYSSKNPDCQINIIENPKCSQENWIYKNNSAVWTINETTLNSGMTAWAIWINYLYSMSFGNEFISYPTLFLKNDVTFLATGQGTKENPYIVK